MEPQRDVFEPLNGLRGVAALAVVVFHASGIMGRQLAPRGYLAVDLFFVLSGFVIAHVYEQRFKDGLGPFRFFWLRVRRFYPLYATGLILGAAVALVDMLKPPAPFSWGEFGVAALAGAAFFPLPTKDLYPLNVPSWSLLCELLINLVYGLLWRWPTVLALIAAGSWLALLDRHVASPDVLTGMLRAGFSFPVGVFLYRYRLPMKLPALPVMAALAAVLLSPFPELLAITLVFPLGIALLAQCDNRPGFETLGRLSFPLYAVHWPLIQFGLGLSHHLPINRIAQGFAWVGMSVAVAYYADQFIDKAVRSRRQSKSREDTSLTPIRGR